MSTINIRSANNADVTEISKLYNGSEYTPEYYGFVEKCVRDYPSAVAYFNDQCIGFAYMNKFAPDILELDNLYVIGGYRSKGIGKDLLAFIELEAKKNFSAIILINSTLYKRTEEKRPATEFYERNGYTLSFATNASNIFTKTLQ